MRRFRLRGLLLRALLVVPVAGLVLVSFRGAAPLAATSPSGTPVIKVVSVLPLVIGPSQTGDAFQTNDRVTYTVSPASPGASTTRRGTRPASAPSSSASSR